MYIDIISPSHRSYHRQRHELHLQLFAYMVRHKEIAVWLLKHQCPVLFTLWFTPVVEKQHDGYDTFLTGHRNSRVYLDCFLKLPMLGEANMAMQLTDGYRVGIRRTGRGTTINTYCPSSVIASI